MNYNFLKSIFLLSALSVLTACSSSSSTECADVYYCPTAGVNSQACVNDSSGWYTAGSQTFSCIGFDCYDAATDLANYCFPVTKSSSDLAKLLGIEKVENLKLNKSIDQQYIDLGNEIQQQ